MVTISRYNIGVISLCLGSIFLLSYLILPSKLSWYVENKLAVEVVQKIKKTTDYLEKQKKIITTLASDPATISLCTADRVEEPGVSSYTEFLKNTLIDNSLYLNLSVVTKKGVVLYSQKNKSLQGQNLADVSFKKKPLGQVFNQLKITQSAKVYFVKLQENSVSNVLMTMPITLKHGVVGFILAELNSSELFSLLLKKHLLQESVEVCLATAIDDVLTIVPLYQRQVTHLVDTHSYYEQLLDASNGGNSQGIILGEKLKKMISAWGYHPGLQAGLLIVFPYDYINYFSYFSLFLFFFFLVFGCFLLRTNIMDFVTIILKKRILVWGIYIHAYYLYFLLGVVLAGLLFSIVKFYDYQDLNAKKSHMVTFEKVQYVGHELNKKLFNLEKTCEELANNLNQKTLTEEAIGEIVASVLKDKSDIAEVVIAFEPYAFTPAQKLLSSESQVVTPTPKLFSLMWSQTKSGLEKTDLHSVYDYTLDTEGFWYQETIKNKLFWGSPYFNSVSKRKIISYSTVFKNNQGNICGVVSVAFPLATLTQFLKSLGPATYQQSLIYTHMGALIYHYNENYVAQNKTLFDFSPDVKKTLSEVVDMYFKKYVPHCRRYHIKGLIPYDTTKKGNDRLEVRWQFALGFGDQDIHNQTYYTYFWLMFSMVFFLFILFLTLYIMIKDFFLQHGKIYTFFDEILAGRFNVLAEKYHKITVRAYCILVGLGCLILWTILYYKPWYPESNFIAIHDQGVLTQFLDERAQGVMSSGDNQLIPIRTGIIINKLESSKFRMLDVIAQVWQTYTKDQLKTIEPGVVLGKMESMTVTKNFEKEENNNITFSWKISAKIDQQVDLINYPFNKKDFILTFEPLDKKNNIICVPDFHNYNMTSENLYPWIENQDILDNLTTSFFSYYKKDQPLEVLSGKKSVNLHIVLRENLLNTLIAYCIPLFIVLFSIFAVLWVNAEKRINGFTGLFFATIFLHRFLRSALNLRSIVYLEYLFLLTYFTLLVLTIGTIFFKDEKLRVDQMKYYFWSVQITILLILAMSLFF